MKSRKTSRVLNDESFFMGLSYLDIVGVGTLSLVLLFFNQVFSIESPLWAILTTAFIFVCLIPIRMNYRRKILRDSMKYISKHGVIHVYKNSGK